MTKLTNADTAATVLDEQQLDQAVGGGVAVPDIVLHDDKVVVHQADVFARKSGGDGAPYTY